MLRPTVRSCLTIFGIVVLNLPGFTQEVRRTLTIEGDVFRIPELSAMISEERDLVKVMMAMPKEMRLKAYRDVDLKEDDIILYLNGKRIKAVKAFEEKYEELAVGDSVQIGIRRDEERFIISYLKADPKDLPQVNIVRRGGPGEGREGRRSGMVVMRTSPGSEGAEDLTPIPSLGIILGSSENQIKVVNTFSIPGRESDLIGLVKGDVIKSLNGKKIESVPQFTDLFDQIKTGEQVNLEYVRGEKQLSASFAKPEFSGQVKIETGKQ